MARLGYDLDTMQRRADKESEAETNRIREKLNKENEQKIQDENRQKMDFNWWLRTMRVPGQFPNYGGQSLDERTAKEKEYQNFDEYLYKKSGK